MPVLFDRVCAAERQELSGHGSCYMAGGVAGEPPH